MAPRAGLLQHAEGMRSGLAAPAAPYPRGEGRAGGMNEAYRYEDRFCSATDFGKGHVLFPPSGRLCFGSALRLSSAPFRLAQRVAGAEPVPTRYRSWGLGGRTRAVGGAVNFL